jgi:hypothetical protein
VKAKEKEITMPKNSEFGGGKRGWLSMKRGARGGAGRGEGSGGMSDYRKQIRANKGAGKNGCSSKLFMLALPIVAIGAYLILAS